MGSQRVGNNWATEQQQRYIEILNPGASECDLIWNAVFRDVIKLKLDHTGVDPEFNTADAPRRKNTETQVKTKRGTGTMQLQTKDCR